MPLPIKVNGTGGEVAYLVLNHTSNNQNFANQVTFPVASVQFNYENQILQRNSAVTFDSTILAVDDEAKGSVNLYPNPVKNQISVSGLKNNLKYEILSIDGKLVQSGTYSSGQILDVSKLVKGVCLFIIDNQNIKFIKD